ncbi:MAG: hypothetical protein AAGF94_11040 [Pseudomonadota bacterium]
MDRITASSSKQKSTLNLDQYGFSPALKIAVGPCGEIEILWQNNKLLCQTGVSYAAIRDDGHALVTGSVRGKLWDRWSGILGVIESEGCWRFKARGGPCDPRSWANAVRERQFQVWSRKSLVSEELSVLDQDAEVLLETLRPILRYSGPSQKVSNQASAPRV